MDYIMDLAESLRSKKVIVKEIPKWGAYLRKQWEDSFADHLSDNDKRSIYFYDEDGFCGYLWHVFSYERRKCLKEEEADIAFNKEVKKYCYIFYQHSDNALILEHASSLTARDFAEQEDIYVVDKEFNWTYAVTHETGWCGPYFSRK